MGKYLGIDASTQSVTGLVIDTDASRILFEESINFDAHFGERYGVANGVFDLGNGQVHSSPQMWADALDMLMGDLAERLDLSEILAVAGSGQQHGTVYLNGRAAAALQNLDPAQGLAPQLDGVFSRATCPVWMDTSTEPQCRQLEQGVGGREALLELSGNTAFERFSGPQIRKFWQEDEAAYASTAYIGLVSSYMASLLAGRLVGVDAGDASGTNMMDIRSRQWAPRALEATAPNLSSRLLPIPPSDQQVGSISPYWVERYGLGSGCRVLPFSGDNPCSLIGLGLVEPGRVALSLGTSDTLFVCMDEPRTSTSGEGAVFASPDGTNYMALICFLNGSLAREAVRDEFGLDWAGFTRALRDTEPGNGGALMLPYFDAEIVPHVSRPGVVLQDLDPGDAPAQVRAVIEAQAMASRIHSDWMGVAIHSLSVTGGASANTEILRIFADVHGCPVHRFQTTNSAALGAALRSAQGDLKARGSAANWPEVVRPFTQPEPGSTVEPTSANAAVYEQLLEKYRELENRHTG